MITAPAPTNAELFTTAIEDLTGESPYSIIAFARTLNNPWEYFDSVREEAKELSIHENFPEEYEEFDERIQQFLDTVDSSLVDEARLNSAQYDKWYVEPEAPDYYSPRQFRQDVYGYGSPKWVVDSTIGSSRHGNESRKVWNRATNNDHNLRIICDYGNFDIALTQKAANATLRVRTSIRKGVPYLNIGGVTINMLDGHTQCMVSGCTTQGWMTYAPIKDGEPDKEWMEYQVLRVLAHLGDHYNGGSNYFNKILAVKPKRDTDAMKFGSRTWALHHQQVTA